MRSLLRGIWPATDLIADGSSSLDDFGTLREGRRGCCREFLLPRDAFCVALPARTFGIGMLELLDERYDASLEATGHRIADFWLRMSHPLLWNCETSPDARGAPQR